MLLGGRRMFIWRRITTSRRRLFSRSSDRALKMVSARSVLMRWGLIPETIADPDSFKTFSTTNARAKTILEKRSGRPRFFPDSARR